MLNIEFFCTVDMSENFMFHLCWMAVWWFNCWLRNSVLTLFCFHSASIQLSLSFVSNVLKSYVKVIIINQLKEAGNTLFVLPSLENWLALCFQWFITILFSFDFVSFPVLLPFSHRCIWNGMEMLILLNNCFTKMKHKLLLTPTVSWTQPLVACISKKTTDSMSKCRGNGDWCKDLVWLCSFYEERIQCGEDLF